MYDIVGDIHGYADELELLLTKLGYQRINTVWQHPTRVLISVGDLIDRGPQQKRTVEIIRSMQEHGSAIVIQGNHEFNAIAYATYDANEKPLRAHTPKNKEQHQKFLNEMENHQDWYKDTIRWFTSLPVLLDLPEFRVVHACWHSDSIHQLKTFTDEHFRLLPSAWTQANDPDHPLYHSIEVLMKGWELKLPENYSFTDKNGHVRDSIRTQWWLDQNSTYRSIALGVPNTDNLPDCTISSDKMPGYDNQKPLFIGHYWLKASPYPTLVSKHVVCVDWSVADKGLLAAYQFDGADLNPENFVTVSVRPRDHFSVEQLSEAFYLADPMNTCCVANDCTDEYDYLAAQVRSLLDDKTALYDAVEQALIDSFDDLVESRHVAKVLIQLDELIH